MELRINKDQISHIRIYDEIQGATLTNMFGSSVHPFIYMPEKKLSWWITAYSGLKKLEAGYYKEGNQTLPDRYKRTFFSEEEINNSSVYFVRDNEIWEKVEAEIYASGKIIKSLRFDSLKEAKDFCTEHFPNVNIILDK